VEARLVYDYRECLCRRLVSRSTHKLGGSRPALNTMFHFVAVSQYQVNTRALHPSIMSAL
jgi:hypothetical protein